MAAGVPVALSTDDEGVSRSDMTNEYLRAVTEQNLRYSQLRRISRDSLTYSFLQGASLWNESGTKLAAPCDMLSAKPSKACAAFLASSPKATEQWRLELALLDYEAKLRKIVAAIPPSAFPVKP
jgi:adenosine deaminase